MIDSDIMYVRSRIDDLQRHVNIAELNLSASSSLISNARLRKEVQEMIEEKLGVFIERAAEIYEISVNKSLSIDAFEDKIRDLLTG